MSNSMLQRLTGRIGPERMHFLRFVFMAGLSVPVNIGSRVIFSMVVPYELAVVASHFVGMATAYALTRRFVFGPSGRPMTQEFRRFVMVNALSLTITWVVSVPLVRIVFPAVGFDLAPELVAHVIGLGIASVASYWGHRRYSFAPL